MCHILSFMRLVFPLLLVFSLVTPAHAVNAIEQLHQFLATTKSFQADFNQVVIGKSSRKPQETQGRMHIVRPGKFRWEVDKPYAQLIVGNDEKIWLYDPELKQVIVKDAKLALGSAPAALLAGEGKDDLEINFILKDIGKRGGLVWLEAAPKSTESGFEKIMLGFRDGQLEEMELIDSFSQMTRLRFSNNMYNIKMTNDLFQFSPPAGIDIIDETHRVEILKPLPLD